MKCLRNGLVVLIILSAATDVAPVLRADDQFLGALSKIATREIRKQLRDKPFHFAQGPLEGHVRAVEPDTRLEAEVKGFKLANDLLTSTVAASGRFEVDGKVDQDADISGVFDVKLAIVAEVRFIEESGKFFIETKIKDMQATLAILKISPANLNGGKQLLSSIALAAFNKNKDRIIAEANIQLGKRPF